MTANKKQVGGDHYKKSRIQHWDFVWANDLDYYQGNITKYVTRWKDKGGLSDLRKAQHYLEKYIELIAGSQPQENIYNKPELVEAEVTVGPPKEDLIPPGGHPLAEHEMCPLCRWELPQHSPQCSTGVATAAVGSAPMNGATAKAKAFCNECGETLPSHVPACSELRKGHQNGSP